MEKKKFKIIRKSTVKPIYIEKCEDLQDNIIYRRRYQTNIYVLYHKSTACYFTIEYAGTDTFSYERLLEFVMENQKTLNTYLN